MEVHGYVEIEGIEQSVPRLDSISVKVVLDLMKTEFRKLRISEDENCEVSKLQAKYGEILWDITAAIILRDEGQGTGSEMIRYLGLISCFESEYVSKTFFHASFKNSNLILKALECYSLIQARMGFVEIHSRYLVQNIIRRKNQHLGQEKYLIVDCLTLPYIKLITVQSDGVLPFQYTTHIYTLIESVWNKCLRNTLYADLVERFAIVGKNVCANIRWAIQQNICEVEENRVKIVEETYAQFRKILGESHKITIQVKANLILISIVAVGDIQMLIQDVKEFRSILNVYYEQSVDVATAAQITTWSLDKLPINLFEFCRDKKYPINNLDLSRSLTEESLRLSRKLYRYDFLYLADNEPFNSMEFLRYAEKVEDTLNIYRHLFVYCNDVTIHPLICTPEFIITFINYAAKFQMFDHISNISQEFTFFLRKMMHRVKSAKYSGNNKNYLVASQTMPEIQSIPILLYDTALDVEYSTEDMGDYRFQFFKMSLEISHILNESLDIYSVHGSESDKINLKNIIKCLIQLGQVDETVQFVSMFQKCRGRWTNPNGLLCMYR